MSRTSWFCRRTLQMSHRRVLTDSRSFSPEAGGTPDSTRFVCNETYKLCLTASRSIQKLHCTHSPWRMSKGEKILHNFWHHFLVLFTKGNKILGVPEMWDWSFLHNCKKFRWNAKKRLKKGQNGVEFFWGPHTYWKITLVAFFYFQYFSFCCFTDLLF